jgi:hypothetical protein
MPPKKPKPEKPDYRYDFSNICILMQLFKMMIASYIPCDCRKAGMGIEL